MEHPLDVAAVADLEDVIVEILAPHPLAVSTDAYKYSMAQAGFPLRRETFVFSFRRGDPQLIPFDLKRVIRRLVEATSSARIAARDYDTGAVFGMLRACRYGTTVGMDAALKGPDADLEVWAPPVGSVVLPTEPLATITGQSFPLSILEPTILMLHTPIQWATALYLGGFPPEVTATCAEEKLLIEAVAAVVGRSITVTVDSGGYQRRVEEHTAAVIKACVDPARVFEVGLRGAACPAQHLLALAAAQEAGLLTTSSTWGANRLGLAPVGTTGHEHQQRWGSDLAAFTALTDMRPGMPSYLFDTYDAHRIGIPSAIEATRRLGRDVVVRFDSGDTEKQLRQLLASDVADRMSFIFEDGLTPAKITKLEELGETLGVATDRRRYGVGGYLIAAPSASPYDRDRVSAAYKLSETGRRPTMKWSASDGKASLPGRPVIFRRLPIMPSGLFTTGIIGQAGEHPPRGYVEIEAEDAPRLSAHEASPASVSVSRETFRLQCELVAHNHVMSLALVRREAPEPPWVANEG